MLVHSALDASQRPCQLLLNLYAALPFIPVLYKQSRNQHGKFQATQSDLPAPDSAQLCALL